MAGKPKYVSPSYEIVDANGGGGSYFVRLAYGYVGGRMDTSNMTTQEVIEEFLRMKGAKTPNEFFDKKFRGKKIDDGANKEDTPPASEQPKKQEVKPLEREPLKDALNKMINDDKRINFARTITKKKLKENIELAQNGVGEITVHLFNEDSFGMNSATARDKGAYFSTSGNYCVWKSDEFMSQDSNYLEKGEAFYHEVWHAIDNNYGESLYTDRYGFPDSSSFMSSTVKLSTGKTFAETLIEEYNSSNKEEEMRADMQTDIDKYWVEVYGMDREQLLQKYHDARAKARQMMNDGDWDGYFAYNDSKEMREIRDAYNDATSRYPKGVKKKWGSLSDVVTGATRGSRSLCGVGHFDYGYWTTENRATELFAEIASAKAANQKGYEMIKKHFPKTVEAFEELYGGLLSGNIKTRGRVRYER